MGHIFNYIIFKLSIETSINNVVSFNNIVQWNTNNIFSRLKHQILPARHGKKNVSLHNPIFLFVCLFFRAPQFHSIDKHARICFQMVTISTIPFHYLSMKKKLIVFHNQMQTRREKQTKGNVYRTKIVSISHSRFWYRLYGCGCTHYVQFTQTKTFFLT